MVRLS